MNYKKVVTIIIFIIILIIFPIILINGVKSSNTVVFNAEMLEKVKTLQNLAEEYINKNNITQYTATDLCMQYIRKDRYNSNLWNMLLGNIDNGFVNFVDAKGKVTSFKNDILLDPITGKKIDFVHMIAPLNSYLENGDTVKVFVSTHYAGVAGDLVTLLEEVTVYRTKNNIQDKNVLQDYCSSLLGTNNPSTCTSDDILADLDAIALYRDSSNGIKSNLYNALYKYYVSTDSTYNAINRLSVAKKEFGDSKSNVKSNIKKLLTDTDFLIIDIKKSFFENSSNVAKVTSNDIDIVSQTFANYVYGEPYLKLKESSGTVTVGNSVDVKIIESNANLKELKIEIENNKIVNAEIHEENLRITPLEGGKTNITVYLGNKIVSSTFELTSKNVVPTITQDLQELYELTENEERVLNIKASGTNNIYTWYIKSEIDETFKKIPESNSDTYKLLPTLEMNNAYIKCGVKNKGNDEIFSVIAKIVVQKNCKHEYILKMDDAQHWEECSECGELKQETKENHTGATHPDGKCIKCNYQYEKHEKVSQEETYEKLDKNTHKIIYKCSVAGCEKTFEGIKVHEGGNHSNSGKCIKCNYQYQIHEMLAMATEYSITENTHTPIYECSYTGCTITEFGRAEEHIVAIWKNNENEMHSGECTTCKYIVEKMHIYEDGKCTECEKEDLKITGKEYIISEGYITKITDKTTMKKFKEMISTNAEKIKILDKDNKELELDDFIGTGMILVLKSSNKTKEFKLVVSGDVTGDGKVDFKDIVSINKYRLHQKNLEEEYLMAGDVTKDNKVDFKDIVRINRFRLNKILQLF